MDIRNWKLVIAIIMIAVLLLAFGCPDSLESIEPFITNVMAGRKPSPEQLQKIKERYQSIGGHSPLLDITKKQAEALEKKIKSEIRRPIHWMGAPKSEIKVFVGMRHWHPFIKDTLKEILDSGAKKIIAVIMTPHHSKFSTSSYINALNEAKDKLKTEVDISFVSNWHTHPLFLEAVADEINKGLTYFKDVYTTPSSPPSQGGEREGVQVIFSAHSLPINEGRETKDEGIGEELYLRQLNETIEAIIKLTGNISWHLGFQSKGMSPGKWLEPTVDSILERLSKEGKKYVLIVPVGFVSDHIETLYDIDIVYRKMAESLGMKFHRTASLNNSPKFIEALSEILLKSI